MGVRRVKYKIYKFLLKTKVIRPAVVVNMDGGVCSQMHQYLLGEWYAQKGYRVCYDLTFFKEWGSDLNCEFTRNFDLLKAFPYLSVEQPSPTALHCYKKKFYHVGNNTGRRVDDYQFLQRTPPLYLGGYYHLPDEVWLPAFRRLFRMEEGVLDEANTRLSQEIKSQACSVGVHVRRGDLKTEVFSYGKPASSEYFERGVALFQEQEKTASFYFFSDEPEWVRSELIPRLQPEGCYRVVDLNGSDKGYMDLFLMAHCRHQITSKGTLGKYSALLGSDPRQITVLCDDETEYRWKELLQNPIFLP